MWVYIFVGHARITIAGRMYRNVTPSSLEQLLRLKGLATLRRYVPNFKSGRYKYWRNRGRSSNDSYRSKLIKDRGNRNVG